MILCQRIKELTQLPDEQVALLFGVTRMTLHRWRTEQWPERITPKMAQNAAEALTAHIEDIKEAITVLEMMA